MLFDLKKKTFIVTGGCSGNGKAITDSIIDHNGKVLIIDKKIIKNNKNNITYFEADISNTDKIIKYFADIDSNLKKNIAGLINNAGITLPSNKDVLDKKKFLETLEINLYSQLFLTKTISKICIKNKYGSIVNITSLGSKLGFSDNISYQISKNLISQITKSQAMDFGISGIRVNNICPGYIKTNMTKKSQKNKFRSKIIENRTILGRWGEPKDLQGATIFLLSEASSYVTGTEIIVDGGWLAKGL